MSFEAWPVTGSVGCQFEKDRAERTEWAWGCRGRVWCWLCSDAVPYFVFVHTQTHPHTCTHRLRHTTGLETLFVKVHGHLGDPLHEEADRLARGKPAQVRRMLRRF